MRVLRSIGLFVLLCCAACDSASPSPADLAVVTTCSELCTRYEVCYQAANPGFMGSTNALVPCENICFSASEQTRSDLRACYSRDCASYLGCGMSAGLKLMSKMVPDLSVSD